MKGLLVLILMEEKKLNLNANVFVSYNLCVMPVFINFFLILRSYGDAIHCRKALHRAVQCTSDYPEHVCEVLLTFERVEGESPHKVNLNKIIAEIFMNYSFSVHSVSSPTGSLEDWDVAVQKTETRLNRVNEQRAKVGAHISFVLGRCII